MRTSNEHQNKASWIGTSGTVKDITTKFPDVREALKTVIAPAGNHRRAIPVSVRHADPGERTDGRLMHAKVTDRQDSYAE